VDARTVSVMVCVTSMVLVETTSIVTVTCSVIVCVTSIVCVDTTALVTCREHQLTATAGSAALTVAVETTVFVICAAHQHPHTAQAERAHDVRFCDRHEVGDALRLHDVHRLRHIVHLRARHRLRHLRAREHVHIAAWRVRTVSNIVFVTVLKSVTIFVAVAVDTTVAVIVSVIVLVSCAARQHLRCGSPLASDAPSRCP
jgi:hypothetical protein